MPDKKEIRYAKADELFLDPLNPRLGRANRGPDVSQDHVRTIVDEWALEELAVSFLESGFWPQEALVVVREPLYGTTRNVVVEGNRRLAALKKLQDIDAGRLSPTKSWSQIVVSAKPGQISALCQEIPYIDLPSRREVQAFLGFRHVSGIKEWQPPERAEFITHLIEDEHLSYDTVRRRIGSKTDAVRRHYITFRNYALGKAGREPGGRSVVERPT